MGGPVAGFGLGGGFDSMHGGRGGRFGGIHLPVEVFFVGSGPADSSYNQADQIQFDERIPIGISFGSLGSSGRGRLALEQGTKSKTRGTGKTGAIPQGIPGQCIPRAQDPDF